MKSGQVQAYIHGLSVRSVTGTPFLVLQSGLGPWLEVEIGPAEASVLLLHHEGIETCLPMTHELLEKALQVGGIIIRSLEIHGWENSGPLCRLHLEQKGQVLAPWPVRPSDGFILALRMGFPIYMDQEVPHPVVGALPTDLIPLELPAVPTHH